MFSGVSSKLEAFSWAVEAMIDLKMGRVVFEVSNRKIYDMLIHHETVPGPREWICRTRYSLLSLGVGCLNWVTSECNQVSLEIAKSVIRDLRCQSYVAFQGPVWLGARIPREASEAT
ncbi:hypothetical protein DY000_02041809 [Brassica cretica]|uniref:RNase H type-1 domain-containing protein n=1 Tax=Brassica cretica TaxID=69181 RepID=A0ABQ7BMY5_BRACR|nr:hypothetical protein DY000_02041809 [Brassica cretica]